MLERGYAGKRISSYFPYVPWGKRTKVAVEDEEGSTRTVRLADASTSNPESSLERILNFLPLFKAFEEFCQKALCSEVSFTTAPITPCFLSFSRLPSRMWTPKASRNVLVCERVECLWEIVAFEYCRPQFHFQGGRPWSLCRRWHTEKLEISQKLPSPPPPVKGLGLG